MSTREVETNGHDENSEFIGFPELVTMLPAFGERTIRSLIKSGEIPAIRLPQRRKLIFHRDSVKRAVLRFQSTPKAA